MDDRNNKIRQNIFQNPIYPKPHLNTGYEGGPSLDFTIPPCGIQDIDLALYKLFKDTIGFKVTQIQTQAGPQNINKPQVIFATGERFALAKKLQPPKDKQGILMLPAISIRRTSIEQSLDDLNSRGINQFTGNIIIKRKLAPEDRDLQNLLNKSGFQNTQGILSNMPETERDTGECKDTEEIRQGGLLDGVALLNSNNIYEIISIPQPQFFTAKYEVIFWTSYTQHMIYMLETLMSSFLPQSKAFKLTTDKGYWFIAYVEDSFSNGENIDDFNEEERIIRYTISISVKGYLLVPQHGTNEIPVRRWLSCPNIVFDVSKASTEVQPNSHLENPPININQLQSHVLSDIETNSDSIQPKTNNKKFLAKKTIIDPITQKRKIKYVSIIDSNQKKGETVYTASDFETLEQFLLGANKR